ncbi:MAG: hypothetical protein IKA61_00635 [Clostridia bacterium]|nr:hypothetical protein [Clostridia bacterium]
MKIKIDFKNDFPTVHLAAGDFDLYVNGFNGCDTVKYGKELSGQTATLKSLCELSDAVEKTVVCAFDTDNYGILKKSVGVFDKGKLLGISDMSVAYSDSFYMPGCGGKLYQNSACKFGVAVEDDLHSFSLFKSLAICGAELIIAVSDFTKKEINSILIRAYSYLLGIPTVLLFKNGCYVSNVNGELISPEQDGIYRVEPYTDFILKTTKTRLKR